MLRLPATKIELGSRDLSWHIDRYEQRKVSQEKQALAANLPARPVANVPPVTTTDPVSLSQQQRLGMWPIPRTEAADDELFSNEPVPQTQAYWDSVMASVGISPRGPGDPSPADVAGEWIDSLPDLRPLDSPDSDRFYTDNWRTQLSEYDAISPQNSSEAGSSQGTSSPKPTQSSEADSDDGTVQLEEDRLPTTESRHRRSSYDHRFAGHDGGVDDGSCNSSSSQPDLNDSAEFSREQERYRQVLTSSEPRAEAQTYQNYFPRVQYNTEETQQHDDGGESDMQINEGFSALSSRWSEPNEHSTTPPLPPNRILDRLRTRSGGLPRSPLYHSQAIASSSPEKDSRGPSTSSDGSRLQSMRLLSQQPTRPHTDNIRSERNSVTGSEVYQTGQPVAGTYQPQGRRQSHFEPLGAGQLAALEAQMEAFELRNSALARRNSFAIDREDDGRVQAEASSSPSTGLYFPNQHIMSSPPDRMGSDGTSLPGSATKRYQTSPTSDSLFHETAAERSPIPLPPPFSTKRRLVSFDLAGHPLPQNPLTSPINPSPSNAGEIETSSPHPPASSTRNSWRTPSYTGPEQQQHQPSSPPREYWDSPEPSVIAMLTPPNQTGPFRVYNDALPASSQPQTPVGLTRGGLNSMPFLERGAFTAPVGTRARARRAFWEGGPGVGGSGMGGVRGSGSGVGGAGLGSPRAVRRRRRSSEQENGEGGGDVEAGAGAGEADGGDVGGLRDMGAWLG